MKPTIAEFLEEAAELRERARVVCETLLDNYHKICADR
jgi:hypothetical protein